MLAVQRAGSHPMRLSGKRAAPGTLSTTPATEPVKPAQEQTVSSATQQVIFVEGQVDGVLYELLVDTGSAVTITYHRLWEQGQLSQKFSHKLQQLTRGPIVTANREPLSILDQTRCKISV